MDEIIELNTITKESISFSNVKKLDKGATVNILANNKSICFKTDFMRSPFGVSLGMKDSSEDISNKKFVLDLDITDDKMLEKLNMISDACFEYVRTHGPSIFGDSGLGLKPKQLADKLAELEANTFKKYNLVKESQPPHRPKLQIKWANSAPVDIISIKGGIPMAALEVTRGSSVRAVIKIRGIFVNALLATIQLDAVALAVAPTQKIAARSIFASDIVPNDDTPTNAKRAKVAGGDDGDSADFDAQASA